MSCAVLPFWSNTYVFSHAANSSGQQIVQKIFELCISSQNVTKSASTSDKKSKQMRASSPVRWRVWTTPGCRPESPCPCSAAPDPSACSRSAGSGRRCRPLTPAARAGGETRRWPSRLPGGRCTAAPGAGWSCSTPEAGPGGGDRKSLNTSRRATTGDPGRYF